jgi:hypothetical protein
MRILKFFIFSTYTLFASGAVAGPFGLEMGASVKELDVAGSGFKLSLNSVPNPHPLFTNYSIWHSIETGVCRILAISKISENDRYGEDVKSTFSRVRKALEEKYGDAKTVDYLKSGALWKETDEWVMAIRQNERTYAALWESPSDQNGEAYSLIQLWVEATSSDTSFTVLEYRSIEFDLCNNSIEAKQDSSF